MPKLVQDIADKVMMNSSSYGINISQDNRNVNTNYMQNNSKYLHEKNKILDNKDIQKKKPDFVAASLRQTQGLLKTERVDRKSVSITLIYHKII